MSNSYECAVSGLYTAIFADIRAALPSVSGLDKDESRLLSTIKNRGLRFVTLDCPAFGKHFDKCLSEGRLVPSSLPQFGMRAGNARSLRFLKGLVSRIFDKDGMLKSHPCVTSIFFIRQLCYAVKKIKIECTEETRETSLQRYFDQELSLRAPTLNWVSNRFDSHCGNHLRIDDVCNSDCQLDPGIYSLGISRQLCDLVHIVADKISTSFGHFDPWEWRFKHGPGAVSDRPIAKFKYNFPTWSERLERVFPSSDFAYSNYSDWVDSLKAGTYPATQEVPCRVLTVPKSQKAPRIIAKEPTAAMWCQQSLRDFLETRAQESILKHCVSFNDQEPNGFLALSSSATGSHWTVDLSDASDRLTLWLVERLFRRNKPVLDALQSSRSIYCEVPLRKGVELLRMKKFAPQGSATTFPLQTIVYSILAISAVLYSRNMRPTNSNMSYVARQVRVFGDDSIVPADSGQQYVDLLTYCGFTVNTSKTYGTGKFRESCGVEAYDGADVTPAYFTNPCVESDPSSVVATIECSNNFHKKGFWNTSKWLKSTVPPWVQKRLRVVGPGDGRFGLFSYLGSFEAPERRYNANLMRDEALTISVSSRNRRVQPGGSGHLLQYFTEKPTADIQWMSGVDDRTVTLVRKQ